MTPAAFRKLALSLPEAVESSHMGVPDFRVGNKIFATLAGGDAWGMVKLAADDQARFTSDAPSKSSPMPGAVTVSRRSICPK